MRGMVPERLLDEAKPGFDVAYRAPGRANLIGEHTDYNGGFVLPVALELATYVIGTRADGVLALKSLDVAGDVTVDLDSGRGPESGWGRYATAVVRALRDESIELSGFRGVLASDVPSGSGLSSSAALEVAIACALAKRELPPLRIATICRRAENEYVGVQVGIMDQLTSAAARAGHALLIDCRDNAFKSVAIPDELRVLVIDSAVRRDLRDSGYNERRTQCEAAASALGLASLREATSEDLERERARMDETIYRRARHIISDNQRVLETVEALEDNRLDRIGPLFEDSHRSYAQDFEASTREIDVLVEIAAGTDGVLGARLTGGGFGGCTVNLVAREAAEAVARRVVDEYARRVGLEARAWVSAPSDGAAPVPL